MSKLKSGLNRVGGRFLASYSFAPVACAAKITYAAVRIISRARRKKCALLSEININREEEV